MEIISLITSILAIALVLLKAWFDSRERKRAQAESIKKQIEFEKRVTDEVVLRLRQSTQKENAGAIDVEDKVDAALRGRK